MPKVFKRKEEKDNKGKRSAEKNEKPTKPNFSESDKSFKGKKDKQKSKPVFERYRDESRPSDFGTKKSRESQSDNFRKKKSVGGPFSADKKQGKTEERSKPIKKTFSKDSDSYSKPSKSNSKDLQESDFEYDKPKSEFKSKTGKGFKGRGYEKKPYVKRSGAARSTTTSSKSREEEDGSIRLNKYIANAGISSRREADDLIASGVVQVNGKTITEMGYRVKPTDIIKYGGQTLKKERFVYLVLNKPKDYITTADDPQKRRTVLELIHGACKERIYPVGRLDRATTGLLMFTNDGDLTKKMTHPKYGVRKIYHAELDKPLKRSDLDKIAEGLELEDGPIKVDEISYVANGIDKTQIGIEIHSGKNRIVRRIFEHLGYNVRKLDRVMFGSLTKKDLARGRWRMLTEAEVGMLKMISTDKN